MTAERLNGSIDWNPDQHAFPEAAPADAAMWDAIKATPWAFQLVMRIARRIQRGSLTVVLPDGRAFRIGSKTPRPEGTIVVKDYAFARRVVARGDIGFAEAYFEDQWATPDLPALLEVIATNCDLVRDFFSGRPVAHFFQRLYHRLRKNTRKGSERNIHAHYDLGNRFYETWLDPSMTYSAARFAHRGQTLAEAQENKYRALAESMELAPEHKVLEIGCGWGGFAEFAAKSRGCRVTGITISREQHDYAARRIFEQGLAEKVDIQYRDYRDVEGHYDRVASIEMFEAVGEEYWPAYFGKIRDVLDKGGQAGLQIITIADRYFESYRRGTDFIQRYIFPGGMLPSPGVLRDQVTRAGLDWKSEATFGLDYADTLAQWRTRFQDAWPRITQLGFDERFRRIWNFYLAYCEAGFRAGNIDVAQVALRKA